MGKTIEQQARELLEANYGETRFSLYRLGRWYVDEQTAFNAIARALTRPAPTEAEVEAAAKRMGEVEVLAVSGCDTMLVKEYLTADELSRMARAALGVGDG